jgi:hypothetical protein
MTDLCTIVSNGIEWKLRPNVAFGRTLAMGGFGIVAFVQSMRWQEPFAC